MMLMQQTRPDKARKKFPGVIDLIAAFSFLCVVMSVATQEAQAFWLSIYGAGGYESVSSKPGDDGSGKYTEPNPSGPNYGLGVNAEFVRFAGDLIGISTGVGLAGFSANWATTEEGKIPSGVTLSTIGLGVTGAANLHFGDALVYLFGEFDYGLFSSSYVTVVNGSASNPAGTTYNNTVNSMMKAAFGAGAGYGIAGFTLAVQGGMSSILINLTPPDSRDGKKNSPVDDSYSGFTVQLVASFELIGPTKSDADSSDSEDTVKEKSKDKPSKNKKKKNPKKKKKNPKKKK